MLDIAFRLSQWEKTFHRRPPYRCGGAASSPGLQLDTIDRNSPFAHCR